MAALNVPAGQQIQGVYDTTKPWRAGVPSDVVKPRWTYEGPFATKEQQLTQQALEAATIPGEYLRQMVQPPLPQIRKFPDRFGYGERTPPSIEDVISIDRTYTEPRVTWYSGGVGGYTGASRNSLQDI